MSRAFTRSSNLRALLSKTECPQVIQHTTEIFERLTSPHLKSSLQTDIRDFSVLLEENDDDANAYIGRPKPWPEKVKAIFEDIGIDLHDYSTFLRPDISFCGVTYSTLAKHAGNSCVMISDDLAGEVPARIQHIIQLRHGQTQTVYSYAAVCRHKKATRLYDPFADHPVLRARLWLEELDPMDVVSLDTIVSHFACLPIKSKFGCNHVAVLPLWRKSQGRV